MEFRLQAEIHNGRIATSTSTLRPSSSRLTFGLASSTNKRPAHLFVHWKAGSHTEPGAAQYGLSMLESFMRTWLSGQSLKIATNERLFNPYVKPPMIFRETGKDKLHSTLARFTFPAKVKVPRGSAGRALTAPQFPPGDWSTAGDGEQVVEPAAVGGCLRPSSSTSILELLRDGRRLEERPTRSSSTGQLEQRPSRDSNRGLLDDMEMQFKALKGDIATLDQEVDEALKPAPARKVTFSNTVESMDADHGAAMGQPMASTAASSSSSSTWSSPQWTELHMTQWKNGKLGGRLVYTCPAGPMVVPMPGHGVNGLADSSECGCWKRKYTSGGCLYWVRPAAGSWFWEPSVTQSDAGARDPKRSRLGKRPSIWSDDSDEEWPEGHFARRRH